VADKVGPQVLAELYHRNCFVGSFVVHRIRYDVPLLIIQAILLTMYLLQLAYRQYLISLNKKLEQGEADALEADEKIVEKSAECVILHF
jgi:hypothetical protein